MIIKSQEAELVSEQEAIALRCKLWDPKYSHWRSRCETHFGTLVPKPATVAAWKDSWSKSSSNRIAISEVQVSEVLNRCKAVGIHPYFWQYYVCAEPGPTSARRVLQPYLVFYYHEDLTMYRLAYG
jgi:hypothetical protein